MPLDELHRNIHSAVDASGKQALTLGAGVQIEPFVSIIAFKHISIGINTIIAPGACIVDVDHDIGSDFRNIADIGKREDVNIGAYCWIGANAVILKGVTLGDGCVVGAGAVVTHS